MSRTYRVNGDTDSRRDCRATNIQNEWRSEGRSPAKLRKKVKRLYAKSRRRQKLTNKEMRGQKYRLNHYW